MEAKIAAWQKEADTLDASLSKVQNCPSMAGVRLLRGRKEELEKKALAAHTLYENLLSSIHEDVEVASSRDLEDQHRRIEAIEEAISQCEERVL